MRGFQSPQFVTDLYRDLRDRRLLSIAIALVAGIIIVPIALSSSSKAPTPAPPPAPIASNPTAPSVAVVASNPGLRDYRKRLLGLGSKDPFKQKFVAPAGLGGTELGGSGLGESVTIGGSDTSSETTTSTSTPTVSTGGGSFDSPSSGGQASSEPVTKVRTKTKTETKYVSYKIKVQTGEAGGTLQARDNLSTLALLPNDSVPALAYIGTSDDHKKALFMVSSVVGAAISGDGVCMLGAPTCQLLILKPGQHEDVLWTDGKTYRVQLVKIERILRSKPPS
jgi:hypothetical protein